MPVFLFTSFSVCTILVFFFFFSYITIVVNLYIIGFVFIGFSACTVLFFFSYINIVVNLYDTPHGQKEKFAFDFYVYSIYQYLFIFLLLVLMFVKHLHNSIDMHCLSFTKLVCSTFVVFYTPFGNHLSHYFYTLIKKNVKLMIITQNPKLICKLKNHVLVGQF